MNQPHESFRKVATEFPLGLTAAFVHKLVVNFIAPDMEKWHFRIERYNLIEHILKERDKEIKYSDKMRIFRLVPKIIL